MNKFVSGLIDLIFGDLRKKNVEQKETRAASFSASCFYIYASETQTERAARKRSEEVDRQRAAFEREQRRQQYKDWLSNARTLDSLRGLV